MSKPPSDATVIKTLRRNLRDEHAASSKYAQENVRLRQALGEARAEANEWRRRFDALLARTPTVEAK